jgi:hypothetical protein
MLSCDTGYISIYGNKGRGYMGRGWGKHDCLYQGKLFHINY